MKKVFLSAFMGVLLAIGLTSMVSVNPEPYPFCQEDCAFLISIGFFNSQGACLSACHACTNGNPSPAVVANCECRLSAAQGGFDEKNFGQCLQAVKSTFGK